MHAARLVVLTAFVAVFASSAIPVAAQPLPAETPSPGTPTPSRFELSAGGLYRGAGDANCSQAGLTLDKCTSPAFGWQLEPAWFLTDRIVIVGRISGLYGSLDTQGTYLGSPSFDVEANTNIHQFYGGIRLTRPWQDHRVSPYVQMLAGVGRRSFKTRLAGVTAPALTDVGLALSPEGGVYVRLSQRFGLQLGGRFEALLLDEGETMQDFTPITRLIFRLGR